MVLGMLEQKEHFTILNRVCVEQFCCELIKDFRDEAIAFWLTGEVRSSRDVSSC